MQIIPVQLVKPLYCDLVKDVKASRCNHFNCQGEMYAAVDHFNIPTRHLAAAALVNGSFSVHRSFNCVHILTNSKIMYICAIIRSLLSSLCMFSPMTFI